MIQLTVPSFWTDEELAWRIGAILNAPSDRIWFEEGKNAWVLGAGVTATLRVLGHGLYELRFRAERSPEVIRALCVIFREFTGIEASPA